MTAPISVRGLTKDFGAQRAVDQMTFDVRSGAVTGFIGSNGSGKTTTMRMLLGLTHPTAGEALIDGVPYARLREPRRHVGAVLDRLGAHPGHTARQHLTMAAIGAGLPIQRVDEALDEVGLADAADRSLRQFSMGMRQRCALAGALLGSPQTLILDEPANGLDPAGIRWLRTTIREWADDGRAVLVSTHQIAELAAIVDDLVVVHEGSVVYSGPIENLVHNYASTTIEDAIFDVLVDAGPDPQTPNLATQESER